MTSLGKSSAQGCSPAGLEERLRMAQGPLAGALSTCNVKAWATGEGEGLAAGELASAGHGGQGLRLL